MSLQSMPLDEKNINTIRFLSIDGVQKANSGHPGMPMGCAPIAYDLYTRHMNYNPKNPKWCNRDRFVLSAGHGSMMLYSMLHLTGYDISMDDLKNFRQMGSRTPGHPESFLTPGVETTTGPLGQGFANAVGMAIAQQFLASVFNKDDINLLDHYIYVIASDGDLMEGISHEAASLAGHLCLNKLIVFYDDNHISIDGDTELSYSEDAAGRFNAYGWHVQRIDDVNDLKSLDSAVAAAQKEINKPSIIITRTHIGFGSPNKQDKSSVHGSPLGEEEIRLTKENLGWDVQQPFHIPEETAEYFCQFIDKGKLAEETWNKTFTEYSKKYPDDANLFLSIMEGNFGEAWKANLPAFAEDGKKMATRVASGKVLNSIAPALKTLIGGSADLAPSNNTYLKDYSDFSAVNYGGRNFHFGIREHAMAGILNGMAVYGGLIVYGGTFLIFSDYMRPSIRLASLSGLSPVYVFTHDSIGLGEDGPTHQAVEHLASLRAIPGLFVIRPADANETTFAWKFAIENKKGPVALILTRQDLPVLDQKKFADAGNLAKGAYVLSDCSGTPDVLLMASGSEVQLVLGAQEKLLSEGIAARVISFPCWELFEQQTEDYKDSVLLPEVKARVAVEAAIMMGWEKYVGSFGATVGMKHFGASAPAKELMVKFGFSIDNIVSQAKAAINK